jgi:hypothetical protein
MGEGVMREQFPPVKINFASVDVTGWPGLTLVAIVVAIAFEFPETRWLLLLGIAGGAIVAGLMILVRARRPDGVVITRLSPRPRDRRGLP